MCRALLCPRQLAQVALLVVLPTAVAPSVCHFTVDFPLDLPKACVSLQSLRPSTATTHSTTISSSAFTTPCDSAALLLQLVVLAASIHTNFASSCQRRYTQSAIRPTSSPEENKCMQLSWCARVVAGAPTCSCRPALQSALVLMELSKQRDTCFQQRALSC